MDYDKTDLPEQYDRARHYPPELLALWLDVIAQALDGQAVARIVDLGCGTGRFSAALAEHFDARVIAIDPSSHMLEQARTKTADPRLRFELAAAEALPLADAAADVVFVSMAFHHFRDPDLAARECRRVLRTGGRVLVRSPTRELAHTVTSMRFFEGAREVFDKRMPSQSELIGSFTRAGFTPIDTRAIEHEIAPNWGALAERVSLKADSILASLEPEVFDAGLRALREHAANAPPQSIREPLAWFVFQA